MHKDTYQDTKVLTVWPCGALTVGLLPAPKRDDDKAGDLKPRAVRGTAPIKLTFQDLWLLQDYAHDLLDEDYGLRIGLIGEWRPPDPPIRLIKRDIEYLLRFAAERNDRVLEQRLKNVQRGRSPAPFLMLDDCEWTESEREALGSFLRDECLSAAVPPVDVLIKLTVRDLKLLLTYARENKDQIYAFRIRTIVDWRPPDPPIRLIKSDIEYLLRLASERKDRKGYVLKERLKDVQEGRLAPPLLMFDNRYWTESERQSLRDFLDRCRFWRGEQPKGKRPSALGFSLADVLEQQEALKLWEEIERVESRGYKIPLDDIKPVMDALSGDAPLPAGYSSWVSDRENKQEALELFEGIQRLESRGYKVPLDDINAVIDAMTDGVPVPMDICRALRFLVGLSHQQNFKSADEGDATQNFKSADEGDATQNSKSADEGEATQNFKSGDEGDATQNFKSADEGACSKRKSWPKRYGSKGITPYGRNMLRSICTEIGKMHGAKCLGFLTCTLPNLPINEIDRLSADWHAIVNRFLSWYRQRVIRKVQSAGGDPDDYLLYAHCTELQEQRTKKLGWHPVLHLHMAFVSRMAEDQPYFISKEEFKEGWRRALEESLSLGRSLEGKCNAATRVEVPRGSVKKAIGRYLGKYLSKGTTIVNKVLEAGYGHLLPKQWWGAARKAVRMVKSAIKTFRNTDGDKTVDLFVDALPVLEQLGILRYESITVEREVRGANGRVSSKELLVGYSGYFLVEDHEPFLVSSLSELRKAIESYLDSLRTDLREKLCSTQAYSWLLDPYFTPKIVPKGISPKPFKTEQFFDSSA